MQGECRGECRGDAVVNMIILGVEISAANIHRQLVPLRQLQRQLVEDQHLQGLGQDALLLFSKQGQTVTRKRQRGGQTPCRDGAQR